MPPAGPFSPAKRGEKPPGLWPRTPWGRAAVRGTMAARPESSCGPHRPARIDASPDGPRLISPQTWKHLRCTRLGRAATDCGGPESPWFWSCTRRGRRPRAASLAPPGQFTFCPHRPVCFRRLRASCHAPPVRDAITLPRSAGNAAGLRPACFPACAAHCAAAHDGSALLCRGGCGHPPLQACIFSLPIWPRPRLPLRRTPRRGPISTVYTARSFML